MIITSKSDYRQVLMFHRLFACLLITLIAGQSVLAAADSHLNVKSGNDHQQTNHSHSATTQSVIAGGEEGLLHTLVDAVSDHEAGHSNDGDNGEQSIDCQHCCHCHNGSQFLAAVIVQPDAVAQSLGGFSYLVRAGSLKFPPALRPPIV
jgi:hypothetical protein